MTQDLVPYGSPSLEGFQKLLNAFPDKTDVRVNAMANNSQYIPISVIESILDTYYSGLWQTVNFRYSVVANEIIGSIDLQVFHPVAKVWITRTGTASAMIQTVKDKPATVENKIKNTLVKDFPHLKSECIKNAAKSLGVRFGRALNRGKDDEYQYLTSIVEQTVDGVTDAYALLETAVGIDIENVRRKIERSTPKNINLIIDYLKNHQQ